MSSTNKVNYINGISPSVAKKIATFWFGDNIMKFETNKRNVNYEIYLLDGIISNDKKIENSYIEEFEKFWTGFKIIKLSKIELGDIE
jgi:hypothetical protein